MAMGSNELDRRLHRLGEHLDRERAARQGVAPSTDEAPERSLRACEPAGVTLTVRPAISSYLARAAVLLIVMGLIGVLAVWAQGSNSSNPGSGLSSAASTGPAVGTGPAVSAAPARNDGSEAGSVTTEVTAPQFVQFCAAEGWAPGTTHRCVLPGVSVGNKLLATACNIENLEITFGDSGDNTWVPVSSSYTDGAGRRCQAGETQVRSGGAVTVTVTLSGSASSVVALMVHEVHGLAAGPAFDDGGWASGCFPPPVDMVSAGTFASTEPGSYALGTVWDFNGSGPNHFMAGSEFTTRVDDMPTGRGLLSEDRVLTTTGPFSVPMLVPTDGPSCWVAFGGAFKPAQATDGGGGTGGGGTRGGGGGATAGLPPASRLAVANWGTAGMAAYGGIPTRSTVCATIEASSYSNGTVEASAGINAAIATCPEGQVVQLSPGSFLTNSHVLVDRPVTLRGAGMGVTTLVKTNGATPGTYIPVDPSEYRQNVIVGGTRWPHTVNDGARNLTTDAVQGSTSLSVDSAAGLAAGQFVEVAEDQFTTASWQPLPKTTDGPNPYQIWAGDRISWSRHLPARQYVDDFEAGPVNLTNSALVWFNRGNGYVYGEVKEIAAIDGNTITFTSPFIDTYRLDHRAQVALFDSPVPVNAGVEDLTLVGGSTGGLSFLHAARSWAKNVEVDRWLGHGIEIEASFRIEVTGSYVHDAVWPAPGGGGYAIALSNNASEALVTNSITINTNKNIVANGAGAGSVISYNYFDDSRILGNDDWQEVGANGSHFAGSHHMLFEGNEATNFDNDFTHGSSYSHTVLRNHFSGFRRTTPATQNLRTIGLSYGATNFSFVGNLLGLPGRMDGWTYEAGPGVVGQTRNIWQLGYEPSFWSQEADPKVLATVIREGNFDYLTSSVGWSNGALAIPDSYYLSAKPTFFGSCRWPWVDPTAATAGAQQSVLPAKARYDANTPRDVKTDSC
jgi:hypothetical protein